MKKIILLLSIATAISGLSQQLSAQLYIPSGASLYLTGNALLYSPQNVTNAGTINISSNSKMVVEGDLTNSGSFQSSGTLECSGGNSQQLSIGNSGSLNHLTINKTSGDVTLTGSIPVVSGDLTLTSGKIVIGDYDLRVSSIVGGSSGSFVNTTGAGKLFRSMPNNANYTYPVGRSSYTPVTINNKSGGTDSFSVRVLEEVYSNGTTGTIITKPRVKKSWDIKKNNPNSGSGVDLSFAWKAADAISLTAPALRHFKNSYWVPQNGSFTATDSSLNYPSYSGNQTLFSIQQNYFTTLNLKAYLRYYLGAGIQNAGLFNFGVSGASSADADTIEVSLRNPENGTLACPAYKAILHTNGTTSAAFPAMAGPYYISLKHRNSIATWSANPVIMDETANYDFSTAANKAYGSNQVQVGPGAYALYSGDLNQDGVIEAADYAKMENDVLAILFGYNVADITGDGVVEAADYALIENNVLAIIFAFKPFP